MSKTPPPAKRPASAVPAETRRIEQVLAIARVILASCSLVAIYIDPTQPTGFPGLAYALLVCYLSYSLAILTWVRIVSEVPARFPLYVHGFDMVWPPVISLFTEGPSTPFFVLFVFVLLAAAYRWRFRETLATAAASVVLIIVTVVLVSRGVLRGPGVDIDADLIVTRVSYLILMGFLLGFLAEGQKRHQAQITAVAGVLGKIRLELGLKQNVRAVSLEILRIFGARRLLLLVRERDSGRAYLWEATPTDGTAPGILSVSELTRRQANTYLFEAPGKSWLVGRKRNDKGDELSILRTLDDQGRPLRAAQTRIAPPPVLDGAFDRAVGTRFRVSKEWSGRLFLLDPQLRWIPESDMRLLASLFGQVAPVLYGVYLQSQLRAQAGAIERTRVARELHDGIIQSLIGVEMELEALRRQTTDTAPGWARLNHVQRVLRQEIVSLRELIQQVKPVDIGPEDLLHFLAATIDRFQHEAGIATRFHSELQRVTLAPQACHELVRILQEALVNVRKHSRARNVLVRFGSENERWRLEIRDDGRGFDFAGTLHSSQVEAVRKAPVILSERVRALKGELTIESSPGRGSRLTITLPRETDD